VNLWRLERVRLFRTMRWLGMLAPFVIFGIAMPIVTRYQEALLRRFGGGVRIEGPPPTPTLAIAAFLQNAMQIGLLVVVLIAAGSLAFDARPEWAAFLRTRVRSASALVVPKFATNAAAAGASFAVGLVAAWLVTRIAIGPLPVDVVVAGPVLVAVYLSFAVAVVACAAGMSRGVIGAGGIALVVLIVLPLLAQLRVLADWMPSALVGAPTALADGEPVTSFLRAVGVTVVATAALLWLAGRLLDRREV
jgi:ABC-2 type transport system permease protein